MMNGGPKLRNYVVRVTAAADYEIVAANSVEAVVLANIRANVDTAKASGYGKWTLEHTEVTRDRTAEAEGRDGK